MKSNPATTKVLEDSILEFKVKYSKDEVLKGSTHSKVSKVKSSTPLNVGDQFMIQLGDYTHKKIRNLSTLLLKFPKMNEDSSNNTRLFIGVNSSLISQKNSHRLCVDIFGGITRLGNQGLPSPIESKFYYHNYLQKYFEKKVNYEPEASQFEIRARMVGYPMTVTDADKYKFQLILALHTPVLRQKMQKIVIELTIDKAILTGPINENPPDKNADLYKLKVLPSAIVGPNDGQPDQPKFAQTEVVTTPMNFKPCPKLPNQENTWCYNLQVPTYLRTEIMQAQI